MDDLRESRAGVISTVSLGAFDRPRPGPVRIVKSRFRG